jgi:hypothetical protein
MDPFFGGAHGIAASWGADGFPLLSGAADPRRDGRAVVLER